MEKIKLANLNSNIICILYQNKLGGTDFLLKRLEVWLKNHAFNVVSSDSKIIGNIDIDLIITPTSEMHRLFGLKKNGVNYKRVLVWAMGHGALRAAFYNKNFEKFLFGAPKTAIDFIINRFTISLIKTNSIVFTDEVGLNHDLHGMNFFDFKIEDFLCPIAISSYTPSNQLSELKRELVYGWVGRISRDFKVLPLIKLINDLDLVAIKQSKKFSLIIVGDGDGATDLEQNITSKKHLDIKWIKEIDNGELLQFIDANIDVLFAMGTSALDGANSGTPTIIVQPFVNPEESPNRGYRWIFDSRGYSLGEFADMHLKPKQIETDIYSIFKDIQEHGLNELSKKSKDYSDEFLENKVFEKMITHRTVGKISRVTLLCLRFLALFYKTKLFMKKLNVIVNYCRVKAS